MAQDQARKRLVHITTVPLSLFFLRGQVQYMKSQGFAVYALSSPDEGLEKFGAEEQIPAHGIPMSREISPWRDLVALYRIIRFFRQLAPTIVHAHTPKGGLLGMIGGHLAGVPVLVYHIHGLPYITAAGWKRWVLMATERVSCGLASAVLCVSPSVKDIVLADGLCPKDKIQVLCKGSINGIDATGRFDPARVADRRSLVREKYQIPGDAVVLGFVGRLVRDKGIVELDQAWTALRAEFPHLHLLLIGPVEERDNVPPAVLQNLQSDQRVHLTGMVWDTPEVYSAIDIVVLPTYREGFPVVPLETAAMALPIVATQATGCVDAIVDGVTGTLVPVGDATALAAGIRRYITDAHLRAQHGNAARERVLQDYRPEDLWRATLGEYESLCRNTQ